MPSTCTVQAPHCAMPQPNFVPVSPSVSRMTQRSGVSGATSTLRSSPLRVKEIKGASCVARRPLRSARLRRNPRSRLPPSARPID